MIAHPPPQQIHTHHLAFSLIILFLTVYPYLLSNNGNNWSVAAFSHRDLELEHDSIREFDIIGIHDVILSSSETTRTKRETSENHLGYFGQESDTPLRGQQNIQFNSLGRKFEMILNPSPGLISNDFTVIALDKDGKQTNIAYDRANLGIFEGKLKGELDSKVTASFSKNNTMITAHINSGQDTVILEPAYIHRDYLRSSSDTHEENEFIGKHSKLLDNSMIVYNLKDHDQFRAYDGETERKNVFDPDSLCAATVANASSFEANHQEGEEEDNLIVTNHISKLNNSSSSLKRQLSKRGIEFWKDQQQVKEKNRCTLHLVADYLFYKHVGNNDMQTTTNYILALVNRVNQIYLPTQWETGYGQESFSNYGFTVNNITIHQEFTKTSSDDVHYNMQSDTLWNAREFLGNFSRQSPTNHYCLSHLLTFRQFDTPVLGLAYVASARYGALGGICSPMQHRGSVIFRHNTGISTSKGIKGERLITRQADLVLAHELGHNLGADHDVPDCQPACSQGGAYLMHPYAVMGFQQNNRFLSNCSRIAIGRVIARKAKTCFIEVITNICGNGLKEAGEECDGGDLGFTHKDECCDSSCRLTPGSQCSDRHSWCCSQCRILPAGRHCRPAEEFNCKQSSHCDGSSPECPNAPPVEDNQPCVGSGLCRDGNCIPFCEARYLHSCLCTTPKDACKLCCKRSFNSTCEPYDQKAPYLPDGVLCYRGICEKGRCEQQIQDVIERLWDVLEDINFPVFVKFLRDNIILVVIVISIPIWCLLSHLINEFDQRVRQDVINTIMKHRKKRKKPPPTQSPFLPRLFVGDDNGSTNSLNDIKDESSIPLKQAFRFPPTTGGRGPHSMYPSVSFTGAGGIHPPPHRAPIGFRGPTIGFQLPEGEEVVIEPSGSIATNSIELPHGQIQIDPNVEPSFNDEVHSNDDQFQPSGTYSTQV